LTEVKKTFLRRNFKHLSTLAIVEMNCIFSTTMEDNLHWQANALTLLNQNIYFQKITG